VKVSIDFGLCTGHGRCYAVAAPSLFVDDERGFGQVKGDGTVPAGLEEEARRAVRSCPEGAINLEE
jgi:ferredoxin